MTALLCIILAYLVGAIPFGLVLTRGSGIDIRTRGSGNIGATNVARLLGKKLGALTLLCDIAKGFLPIWLAARLLGADQGTALAFVGAATVLGHMFPIYLRFRGGKGVATALGLFLCLAPWAVAAALALFLVVVRCSGFVSAGSLSAAVVLPIAIGLSGGASWVVVLALFVAAMIWIKHRANIRRLLDGTEKSWKRDGAR